MTDDLDDILGDGRRADMEARFRELEQQEELERMRRGEAPRARGPSSGRSSGGPSSGGSAGSDDLSDLKSKLEGDGGDSDAAGDKTETPPADSDAAPADQERYVLILCPKCGAKNRTSLTKVRTRLPRCGACKASLSFTKL